MRKLGKRGRAVLVAGGELHLAPGLREFVPRARREAVVAAVDAVADERAQLARDRALVLDGEIRDAAPRIELVGRGKRGGGAHVQAGAAAAAVIGFRRVGRKLQRGEETPEK